MCPNWVWFECAEVENWQYLTEVKGIKEQLNQYNHGTRIRSNPNCIVNMSTIQLSIHVHNRKALNSVPFDRIPSATIDEQSMTGRLVVKCMFEQTHTCRKYYVETSKSSLKMLKMFI